MWKHAASLWNLLLFVPTPSSCVTSNDKLTVPYWFSLHNTTLYNAVSRSFIPFECCHSQSYLPFVDVLPYFWPSLKFSVPRLVLRPLSERMPQNAFNFQVMKHCEFTVSYWYLLVYILFFPNNSSSWSAAAN